MSRQDLDDAIAQPAGGASPLSPQAVSAEGAHRAYGHTPGPWEATERHDYHEILGPRANANWYGAKGVWAVAYADTDRPESEQIANARLIANAPLMLATLRQINVAAHFAVTLGDPEERESWRMIRDNAAAAIRKATGEA